jgi:uncharacterized protein YjiS (DUF1127 family)
MSYSAARLSARRGIVIKALAAAASLKAIVLQWRQRHRGRTELAGMSDRDRRDLGYSSSDVDTETAKPFWLP